MSRQELRSTGGNCRGDDRQESCSSAGNCQADEQTVITHKADACPQLTHHGKGSEDTVLGLREHLFWGPETLVHLS